MRHSMRLSTLLAMGVCLAMPALAFATASTSASGIERVIDASRVKTNEGQFLPPDQAFRLSAQPSGSGTVRLDWQIADGYYLYRQRIKVATTSPLAKLGTLDLPQGETKTDEYFGTQQIYHHELVGTLPVLLPGAASGADVPIQVTYQGCATAGLCYPPITKTFTISLTSGGSPAAAAETGAVGAAALAAGTVGSNSSATPFVSDQDRYASVVRSGGLLGLIALFYAAGLALAFTPCVLPMVPILSGIIVGHGRSVTAGRGFALSLAYVIGLALTYTAAGIAVAAGGDHVQAAFQQPWIIAVFAALFVVLALSMFGLYTLQMPAAIQTRLSSLSSRQSAGTFGGVFVMGALSALIVTTCVAPALVGALVVIGQSGDMVRGGLALFVMGLGMGTPLLVVGASAGKLLPRAGAWMDIVKRLFGALMLAVAAWMLARILPGRLVLIAWAAPAIAAAYVLWVGAASLKRSAPFMRIAAAVPALYGIALLAGAALGASDPLAPLPGMGGAHEELTFQPISSLGELNRRVALAHADGRSVMLDFYADWCVSCKEMEKYTFTDRRVETALDRTVLLRADVTRNDQDDQALLKAFGIFGPPTIAFYGPNGAERREYRVVGYMKAADFASLVRLAVAAAPPTARNAMP